MLPPENQLLQIQSKIKELEIGFRGSILQIQSKLKELENGFRGSILQIQSKMIPPLVQIPSKLEELQIGFRRSMVPALEIASKSWEFLDEFDYWASQQPFYIDAAVSIAHGIALYCLVPCALHKLTRSKMVLNVRGSAVFWTTARGVSVISHRLKGVKGVKGEQRIDVQTAMISSFAATFMYLLVDDKQCVTICLLASLFCGGAVKLKKVLSKPQEEDPSYMKTKGVLKNLGRDTYEKNFKKGMLIDNTLPFLTDR